MEFVYFVRPPRPSFINDASEEERAVMSDHFHYLLSLLEQGNLVLAGPMLEEGGFGITIFEADDEEHAAAIAAADPAVKAGLITADFHPFRVSLLRGRPVD
ncbi:MAG: YciI family protein [Dehalococcoidia bacterium]